MGDNTSAYTYKFSHINHDSRSFLTNLRNKSKGNTKLNWLVTLAQRTTEMGYAFLLLEGRWPWVTAGFACPLFGPGGIWGVLRTLSPGLCQLHVAVERCEGHPADHRPLPVTEGMMVWWAAQGCFVFWKQHAGLTEFPPHPAPATSQLLLQLVFSELFGYGPLHSKSKAFLSTWLLPVRPYIK